MFSAGSNTEHVRCLNGKGPVWIWNGSVLSGKKNGSHFMTARFETHNIS